MFYLKGAMIVSVIIKLYKRGIPIESLTFHDNIQLTCNFCHSFSCFESGNDIPYMRIKDSASDRPSQYELDVLVTDKALNKADIIE